MLFYRSNRSSTIQFACRGRVRQSPKISILFDILASFPFLVNFLVAFRVVSNERLKMSKVYEIKSRILGLGGISQFKFEPYLSSLDRILNIA